MSKQPTRKIIRMTLEVIAEGDYYEARELPDLIDGWCGSALEDRSDIREWTFRLSTLEETAIPETKTEGH